MDRKQQVVTASIWGAMVVLMVGVVAAGVFERPEPRQTLPVLASTPLFTLLDQDSRAFGSKDLVNHAWIADFVFTRCSGPCPQLSRTMAMLQRKLARSGVLLVTFTVDPENDRPAVLKQYAASCGADERRWKFLTGDTATVGQVARSMNAVAAGAQPDDLLLHKTQLLLLDGAGRVRGVYSYTDANAIARLVSDARTLDAAPSAGAKDDVLP